jgi:hypothetical protein
MIDREKIAHAIWKNITSTNSKVSNVRTLEAFADAGPQTREKWLRMAEAVMCVIPQAAPESKELTPFVPKITPPWEVPSADREKGVDCLAFFRGKWVHVTWSPVHECWLFECVKGFLSDDPDQKFALLPSHPNVNLNVEL